MSPYKWLELNENHPLSLPAACSKFANARLLLSNYTKFKLNNDD